MRLFEYEHGQSLEQMIAAEYRNGATRRQIAMKWGVPLSTVRLWEDRLGVRTERVVSIGSERIVIGAD